MSRLPLFFLAALPFVESPALAAGPVAPEPAPPAQRNAPPDKIAPPMHVKGQPLKPETTGRQPDALKPGDPRTNDVNGPIPSSPADAAKCTPGKKPGPGAEGCR